MGIRSNNVVHAFPRVAVDQKVVPDAQFTRRSCIQPATKLQITGAVFNWLQCIVALGLMTSQLLAAVWSSSTSEHFGTLGQQVSLGVYPIAGYNDEPYSDRLIVCIRRGRRLEAISVNEALSHGTATIEDTIGSAMNGYRVVHRSGMTLDASSKQAYTRTCSHINRTLDYMFTVCNTLGYTNLTQDNIRIVGNISSKTMWRVKQSLPVLVMPYWDNAVTSRYAIPGNDGQACVFALGGQYEDPTLKTMYMVGTNRTAREAKTMEWLGRFGGTWKNGWYEDLAGMRWYSDLKSTARPINDENWITSRYFNVATQNELVCRSDTFCIPFTVKNSWGATLENTFVWISQDAVAVSNGLRFGLFFVKYSGKTIVACAYDVATFISDVSVVFLLGHWMLMMTALHRGYYKGVSNWYNADIGCLSASRSFNLLLITLLPRLSIIIPAFFTIGCGFEGDQSALTNSWFIMYPAIVEIILIYNSLVNIVARILRWRVNSALTSVTIMLLSLLHALRSFMVDMRWFGYDGRISTIVSSNEFESTTLFDYFTSDIALRLNGNIKALFAVKLVLLLSNTVPLIFSMNMSPNSKHSRDHKSCTIEMALSIRVCNVGGMGSSSMYENCTIKEKHGARLQVLNPYELVRLGYVVVGNRYLISCEDWVLLLLIRPFRRVIKWRSRRIMVFELMDTGGGGRDCHNFEISMNPRLVNVAEFTLLCINWWDIDARPIQ